MRIGVLDLDTSHPQAFLPLLRARGHEVVGVYGGETVVDDAYTRSYAASHGIPSVVTEPAGLIELGVDTVFIHGVDWQTHLDRARPFLDNGIAVHICKPFAGSAAELRELIQRAGDGARISGGSALRWSAAAQQWRDLGRRPRTGYAVTYGHPLDYGVHAYSLLQGLLGPGIERARALDEPAPGSGSRRVELRWPDGRSGIVEVAQDTAHGYTATVVSDESIDHVVAGGPDLYDRFLNATLGDLAAPHAAPLTELVEPELAAIAALVSAIHDGAWIGLHGDPRIDEASFQAKEFTAGYRRARRRELGLAL